MLTAKESKIISAFLLQVFFMTVPISVEEFCFSWAYLVNKINVIELESVLFFPVYNYSCFV